MSDNLFISHTGYLAQHIDWNRVNGSVTKWVNN